jgi:thioesterase domain-containing protein/acyl carrier protein
MTTQIIAPTHTPIARSAAEIRDWVAGELAVQLKVPPASIDTAAPLYSLGADSLAGLTMTGALAGWLGRDLPATLIWDYESIDAIAEALASDQTPTYNAAPDGVIEFQPRGNLPPVFFMPGIGGHPVTFAALASHLGPDQPSYGLCVPGLNGTVPPLTSVEEVAAVMVQNIRIVQPRGPYQLAGYSFGGLLAYEAAQQLTAAGQTVSMLAIYDTYTPAGRTPRPWWQRAFLHAWLVATRPGRLRYIRERLKLERTANDPRPENGDEKPTAHDNGSESINEVTRANLRAAGTYKPLPYSGKVLLFRAMARASYSIFYKTKPAHGWAAIAAGGVTTVDLTGTHLSILSVPHAATAADAVRPFLAR